MRNKTIENVRIIIDFRYAETAFQQCSKVDTAMHKMASR